ncbi:hypothetical protein [Pseudomonas fluorescens]|nr:hypothetical protein [Pseudomonas fluorescens]
MAIQGVLKLSEMLDVRGKLVFRHQRSQVLNGIIIFKIGMPSLFLVLAESARVQVGPIKNIQRGAAQALCFAEKLVVTFKSLVETGYGLMRLSCVVHCRTLLIDLFLFFQLNLLCHVGRPARVSNVTTPLEYFTAIIASKPSYGDVVGQIGSRDELMAEIEFRPLGSFCSVESHRVSAPFLLSAIVAEIALQAGFEGDIECQKCTMW